MTTSHTEELQEEHVRSYFLELRCERTHGKVRRYKCCELAEKEVTHLEQVETQVVPEDGETKGALAPACAHTVCEVSLHG